MSMFTPATRHQLKARIALDGPTGSGKSWTALAWATALAGTEGRIAAVDTERGSLSLYSDRFKFDVLTYRPPYDPRQLAAILREADAEYDVILVDSLTHFWKGEGGTLDIVDGASRSQGGNSYAGWSTGTPALRTLIDTMLGLDAHFIATMRSKMEHVLVEDDRGRKVPQKIGMAPEMRADIEYEFTLCVSYDLTHTGIVTKSRCEALADQVIRPGLTSVQDTAQTFLTWLREGAPEPTAATEDMREALRAWLNTDGKLRHDVRNLWPVTIPTDLASPDFTVAHAERLEGIIRHVGGDAPAPIDAMVAAAFGWDGGNDPESAPSDPPSQPDTPSQDPPAQTHDDAPDAVQGDSGADTSGDGPAVDTPVDNAPDNPEGAPGPDPAETPGDAPSEADTGEDNPPASDAGDPPPAVDPAVAEARTHEVIAMVKGMSVHDIAEDLHKRGKSRNGNTHTLSARLVQAILADEGIVLTQATAKASTEA